MRVEAPTTFQTAYQQGRVNARTDEKDAQALGFNLFDERRARDKHEYEMDFGEEKVRHAKTMNPLLESIGLYKNKLAWGTLDTDIADNKEDYRHKRVKNKLEEQDAKSDLDRQIELNNQINSAISGAYGPKEDFGASFAVADAKHEKKKEGLVQSVTEKALYNEQIDQDIKTFMGEMDYLVAGGMKTAFSLKPDKWKTDLVLDNLHNAYSSPAGLGSGRYDLAFKNLELSDKGYTMAKRLFEVKNKGIDTQEKAQKEIKSLLDLLVNIPKAKNPKTGKVWGMKERTNMRKEYQGMIDILNGIVGGGGDMTGVMQFLQQNSNQVGTGGK